MAITLQGNGLSTFSNNITSTSGDLTLGDGNLVVANGHGIDFSATPGTGTSELFDDYEQGTFTPSITAGITNPTYLNQGGTYTKIGNLITFTLAVETNGGTDNGSVVVLSGMPFQSSATANASGGFLVYVNGLTDMNTNLPLIYIGGSVSALRFYVSGTGNAWLGTTANGLAGKALNITGQYYTDL